MKRSRYVWVALVVVLIGAGVAFWLTAGRDAPRGRLTAVEDPPPMSHIHGLGVNPADGTLFAATHSGLYRIRDGRASIVANRYQDTMGFTVVGADHFAASGHPDLREELPPLLGLLESRDAGRTWTKKSLLGKADFHALRYAHGTIWGYDSTSSNLMTSDDGKRWDVRSSVLLRDFVVSPGSPDVVIASNGESLRISADGGRDWARLDSPAKPLLLAWEAGDALWLLTVDGIVFRSRDAGGSWRQRGEAAGQPQAFLASGDVLYVATHERIFRSEDGAKTWQLFFPNDV